MNTVIFEITKKKSKFYETFSNVLIHVVQKVTPVSTGLVTDKNVFYIEKKKILLKKKNQKQILYVNCE